VKTALLTETENKTHFIEANTIPTSLDAIKNKHIVPVFIKDNEPAMSNGDFIQIVHEVAGHHFPREQILNPIIRVSHPVKGRIPQARSKPASELLESEKTIYYERMMFMIEIPTISKSIGGHEVTLSIGGVKAYNQDKLHGKRSDQQFKVFIGFKNTICCNLCIWTDGLAGEIFAKEFHELTKQIYEFIGGFEYNHQLHLMEKLTGYELTEKRFAQLIGKARLYQHMPLKKKKGMPKLLFNDSQVSKVARDYYGEKSFCRKENGNIDLWRLYNLFTSANKSSYIDQFLDRGVNATRDRDWET